MTTTPSTEPTTEVSQMTHEPEPGATRPGKPRGIFPRRRPSKAAPALTDAEAEALAQHVPDDPIALPAEHLACLACGIATPTPADREAVTWAEASALEGSPSGLAPTGGPVPLTRCPECATLRARAADLLAEHPRVRDRIGGADAALHRVESALYALAVLGRPVPPPGRPMAPEELAALLRHLSGHGADARWLMRFAPIRARDARPGTCSPRPWAHVRLSLRATLREGYAAVLRERVAVSAPPLRIRPPALTPRDLAGSPGTEAVAALGACLLCGIAAVTLPAAHVAREGGRAAAASSVWRLLAASPATLGGRAAPARVVGHTCPDCTEALRSAGAVGQEAILRAVVAHLTRTGRDDDADRLRAAAAGAYSVPGLVGYGALCYSAHRREKAQPPPNAEPWAHLSFTTPEPSPYDPDDAPEVLS